MSLPLQYTAPPPSAAATPSQFSTAAAGKKAAGPSWVASKDIPRYDRRSAVARWQPQHQVMKQHKKLTLRVFQPEITFEI